MTDLSGYAKQGEAFKWATVGDTLKGEVTKVGEIQERTNKFTDKPETILPFTVTNADGDHGVYARLEPYSSLGGAVVDAVNATGNGKLKVGGTIAIQYQSDLDTGKPQPARIFVAQYKPPTAGADLLADDAKPAQPAATGLLDDEMPF